MITKTNYLIEQSLHKPKAPPPPPPVSAVVTKQPESKLNNKQKTTEDEFIVDVSSPCKIVRKLQKSYKTYLTLNLKKD